MTDGSGYQEGESRHLGAWASLKEAGKKIFGRRAPSTVTESSAPMPQEVISIPEGSGYAGLIEEAESKGNSQQIGRWLRDLYPDLLSLLSEAMKQPDGNFTMKISEKWGFSMDQETRIRAIEALNAGNKKVIAVLAFYLGEKAVGNLPLKAEVNQKGAKMVRLNIDRESRNLRTVFEDEIRRDERLFSAENDRGKLREMVAGVPRVFVDSFASVEPAAANPISQLLKK